MEETSINTKIAIIGMSCRVAQADTPDEFWMNLINGVESIKTFTDQELGEAGIEESVLKDPQYVKRGAIIDNIEYFDADFFNYTPREAEIIDPQHRLFLECAWQALEDAACIQDLDKYITGVYASSCFSSYLMNLYSQKDIVDKIGRVRIGIGNEKDFLASKIAFKLGLKGPAVNIQTACSSSLVAVHMACQSLLNGECDIALAGGVTIRSQQIAGYFYQKEGLESPDGHCRVFDKHSKGTVFGNGLGIVVLKRLEDALADNDNITAVINSTAVNNDGAHKIGYTAPGLDGQVSVINEALTVAGLVPEDISYIETHGTGTELGDAIEMRALKEVFQNYTGHHKFCTIGSVKPNIGHTDVAAGIMGLIKTALALKYKTLPPCINYAESNPKIAIEKTPFSINTDPLTWEKKDKQRRAGISSFGVGGTNAHVILEETADCGDTDSHENDGEHLIILSAKTENSLIKLCKKLSEYVRSHKELKISDVSYTLQVGRAHFSYRTTFVCSSLDEMVKQLDNLEITYLDQNIESKNVLIFTPHDTLIDTNFKQLYHHNIMFAERVDKYCEIFHKNLNFPIIDLISLETDKYGNSIYIEIRQFIFHIVIASLLDSLEVSPQVVIGSGSGLFSALCLTKIISEQDILRIFSFKLKWQLGNEQQKAYAESELTSFLKTMNCSQAKILLLNGTDKINLEHLLQSGFWLNLENINTIQVKLLKQSNNDHKRMILIGAGYNDLKGFKKDDSDFMKGFLPVFQKQESGTDTNYEWHQFIGKLWQSGCQINWNKLYRNNECKRINLPVYSFDRKKYWIEKKEILPLKKSIQAQKRNSLDKWLYTPVWQQFRNVYPESDLKLKNCGYIIFADTDGIGEKIASMFSKDSNQVYIIKKGDAFNKSDQFDYTINPEDQTNYEKIFSDVINNHHISYNIIYLWSIENIDNEQELTLGNIHKQMDNFYSLLYIGKSILALEITKYIRLCVVNNCSQLISDNDEYYPSNALLNGPMNVLPQEISNLSCQIIDIQRQDFISADNNLSYKVLYEELSNPKPEKILVIRGQYLWKQTFIPIPANLSPAGQIPLQCNGVYLITGGIGDIGLTQAHSLVGTNPVNIILVQRSSFPERKEWNDYLNNNSDFDITNRKILKIKALEEKGARIHIYQADVANETQMREVINNIELKIGKINGIIHSAGVVVYDLVKNSISNLTPKNCEKVFTAKVTGLITLEKLIRGKQIDFFIINSSISSLLGGIGLTAYAAANSFVDHYVQMKNRVNSPVKWLSINWDAWNFTTSNSRDDSSDFDRFSLLISPEEGKTLFSSLLAIPKLDRIVVSTTDLQQRFNLWQNSSLNSSAEIRNNNRKTIQSIKQLLIKKIKEYVGIDFIDPDDNFFDLGITSMDIMSINDNIQNKLSKNITIPLWFEYPNINALSTYLEQENLNQNSSKKEFDRSEILNNGKNKLKSIKQKSRRS